jgi:hypothetical protein
MEQSKISYLPGIHHSYFILLLRVLRVSVLRLNFIQFSSVAIEYLRLREHVADGDASEQLSAGLIDDLACFAHGPGA